MPELSADPADVLLTMAEVSVAFAGFASLIAVFEMRSSTVAEAFDLLRYWVMLEFSIAALVFTLLPFIFSFLGAGDVATWRTLSALLALFVIVHNVVLARLYRRGHDVVRGAATPASLIPAQLVYAAMVVSQLGNAAGLLDPPVGWYMLGLFLVFVVASAHFVIFIARAVSRLRDSR